jgi:type II secretory pathway pseudopilin PulG
MSTYPRQSKSISGFTLIETLLYIALFSVVVGGCIMTAVALIESSTSVRQRTAIEAEGAFIVQKIEWALTGSSIAAPPSGATSTALTLTRGGMTYTFAFSSSNITLAQNGGAAIPLNTLNAPASGVVFMHLSGTPGGVEYTFFLGGKQFGPKTRYLRY